MIKQYIRQNVCRIALYCAFFAIYCVCFALYNLPLPAIIYPGVLCAALGLTYGIYDYAVFLSRHNALAKIKVTRDGLLGEMPANKDLVSADYAAIIALLQDEMRLQKLDYETKSDETISYYTIWAHQIKTPIAAVKLALQNDDSPLSLRLGGEINRIEQYVEMVLCYLRLGSTATDYVFVECDLDRIIKQSVKRFSSEFIDRRLGLDFTPTERKIVTDSKWLSFVIEQIISNSLKYTPSGKIGICVKDDRLCISDTGIGIAPTDLPRVFEKGFTGYNGRSDTKASGIGLYLCKRICDALGIEIEIDSTVSVGTEVRLSLSQYKL